MVESDRRELGKICSGLAADMQCLVGAPVESFAICPGRALADETSILRSEMVSFLREFWTFLRVREKFRPLPALMMIFGSLLPPMSGPVIAPLIDAIFQPNGAKLP